MEEKISTGINNLSNCSCLAQFNGRKMVAIKNDRLNRENLSRLNSEWIKDDGASLSGCLPLTKALLPAPKQSSGNSSLI